VATLDYDAPEIFARSSEFIARVTAAAPLPSPGSVAAGMTEFTTAAPTGPAASTEEAQPA
jgi:hypothetical protein